MPHDLHGNKLDVGDIVNIPCKIKSILLTEEYCNIEVETTQVMYPGDHRNTYNLNAKQVIKNG